MTKTRLEHTFDPCHFRQTGHRIIDILADFLESSLKRELPVVLPDISPDAMLERWQGDFQDGPASDLLDLVRQVLADSNNLQHPRYVGHQCCTALPAAALCELVGAFLNNGTAVYEMGPVNVAMEKRLVQWMAGLIGYDSQADGIFTHGGTLGNLTALLAARQCLAEGDVWTRGVRSEQPVSVLVSDQCHYSVKRAVAVMGLGEDAVCHVPVDARFKMTREGLEERFAEAETQGRRVIAVVGNACSTATGTYDNFNMIADFAQEHQLWFHVDGAHGASALLSHKYRHLLNGLDRADSMVWDAHKMLMIPALATAVVFRDGSHSYEAFSQKASYLFEKESHDEWYNFAHRTMECTKTMMGLKLYVPLAVYGVQLFSDFVTRSYDLTRTFAGMIKDAPDFELAAEPESNIICFRYVPSDCADPDGLQKQIRTKLLEDERFYVVQTMLGGQQFLRCTLINPNTTVDDLSELLDVIRSLV